MSHYKVLVNVCPPTLPKEEVSVNIGFKGEDYMGCCPEPGPYNQKLK